MQDGKKTWYIGYITDIGKDEEPTIQVEHLHRVSPRSDQKWANPEFEDKCEVQLYQVLNIEPRGEWGLNLRYDKLTLKKWKDIKAAVDEKSLASDK